MKLIIATLSLLVGWTAAFGKYRKRTDALLGSDDPEASEVEIEVIAAILIASLFTTFILTYAVFLICWRIVQKRKKVVEDFDDSCVCLAQKSPEWERMDLDKFQDLVLEEERKKGSDR